MSSLPIGLGLSLALVAASGPFGTASLRAQSTRAATPAMTLSLAGTDYLHRWSKGGQHEFTPQGQEDLSKSDTMLTLTVHEPVRTGDLAVYSKRVYGTKAGNDMSAWLEKSGPEVERQLMGWTGLPTMARLKALR